MADIDVGAVGTVYDSTSLAEDISMSVDDTPTGYVADVILLSEYTDVTVGGEGAMEVADGKVTEDTISAVSLFTMGILPRRVSNYSGYMNISISGTFTGTIELQRSYDRGITWHAVDSFTAPEESSLTDLEIGVRYRLGCPTAWTSGTALCRLGIGG